MAKMQDINSTPTVSSDGVKFVVVKNGKFAQCDLADFMKKVNEEYPAAVNASISKLDEAQNNAITEINKKLEDVLAKYNLVASDIESLKLSLAKIEDTLATPAAETESEEKTTKSTKKSKKSAEA
jgi:hypothetical protein